MLILSDDDETHGERETARSSQHSSLRFSLRSDGSTGGQASWISSRHSDFTLPISNRLMHNASPPTCVPNDTTDFAAERPSSASRRPIFPTQVQQKYDVTPKTGSLWITPNDDDVEDVSTLLSVEAPSFDEARTAIPNELNRDVCVPHARGRPASLYRGWSDSLRSAHDPLSMVAAQNHAFRPISPLASPTIPSAISSKLKASSKPPILSSLPLSSCWSIGSRQTNQRQVRDASQVQAHHGIHHSSHATSHAQSLLVALAVAAVWTPSNLLAPNLTLIARDLNIIGAARRDLYLGSYCALASSVLSAPMGAGIGVLADLAIVKIGMRYKGPQTQTFKKNYGSMDDAEYRTSPTDEKPRTHGHITRHALFCWTILGGATTAWLTGSDWCTHYWQLLVLRILNGGCMTGCVPVAFSIMADWFSSEQRNAASSGLTAMMGLGMICGQIFAGVTGPQLGWKHSFRVSGLLTFVLAVLCFWLVQEPERGGKEKALKNMIECGKKYDRKLTWSRFWQSVRQNRSNSILIWQGFFSSIPWGIISVFLNDYLSQERGFTVGDATFMVACFGVGSAFGGILGGVIGQRIYDWRKSWLPLYMAITTMLGILPFVFLLNTHFTDAHGPLGLLLTLSGGFIANLPSVNSRPCIINVNPPESRGAALTASNVLVNLGRGVGPSSITLMVAFAKVDRQLAFNVTLIVFWTISAIQLLALSTTLAHDQEAMEAELAEYAVLAMDDCVPTTDESMDVSVNERLNAFDDQAARETLFFVKESLAELRHDIVDNKFFRCVHSCRSSSSTDSDEDGFAEADASNRFRVEARDETI